MMCAACVQTVSKALLALNGVLEVTVSLGQKTAKARFDSTCVRPETIREEIDVCPETGLSAIKSIHDREILGLTPSSSKGQGKAKQGQESACWLRNRIESEECRTRSLSII